MDDRTRYITAKALAIALKVLEQERPYRQGDDIADMWKLFKSIGMPVELFRSELEMIDEKVAEAIQRASAWNWQTMRSRNRLFDGNQ